MLLAQSHKAGFIGRLGDSVGPFDIISGLVKCLSLIGRSVPLTALCDVSLSHSQRIDKFAHVHHPSLQLLDLTVSRFKLLRELFLLLSELLPRDPEQLHLVLVIHELRPYASKLFLPLIDLGHVRAGLKPVLLHDIPLPIRERVDLLLHLLNLPALLLRETHLLRQCLLAFIDLRILVAHLALQVVVFLPRTRQLDLDVTQTLLQFLDLCLCYLH